MDESTSTTQSSSSVYPSGNGTAGGNFLFRFNVLPGDANQDGTVNVSDLAALGANWQQSRTGWANGDFNSDGVMDVSDLAAVGANWQRGLPTAEPVAPTTFNGAVVLGADAPTLSASDSLTPTAALMVDTSTASQGSPQPLTDQQLTPIVARPNNGGRLRTCVKALAAMAGVKVQLADLPAGVLAETIGNTILIDRNAAGHGWFARTRRRRRRRVRLLGRQRTTDGRRRTSVGSD